MPELNGHLTCGHCEVTAYPVLDWRQFRNETWHLEARCPACARFIQWVPQVEPWIDGIEPHA